MEALTGDALMVVEVLGTHHRVRARHRIGASGAEARCTVGRSAACDVLLDDPFVAAVHAEITVDAEGAIHVSDLGSVNGIEVGGRRLHGVERVPVPDGMLRIGRTRLRVRTAREVVAPEQAEQVGSAWRAGATDLKLLALGFTLSVALTVFEVWTNTPRPQDLSTALVTALLVTFALAGLWIALWALATRVAFGESRWARHATIAFGVYAVVAVAGLAIEIVNGALGLHLSPSVTTSVLLGAAASAALSGHLLAASPMRASRALAIGVMIPALALGVTLWFDARSQNRSANHVSDGDRVLPPALLLRHAVALDAFAATIADLQARADAKRAFVEREDPSSDDEADE